MTEVEPVGPEVALFGLVFLGITLLWTVVTLRSNVMPWLLRREDVPGSVELG